VAAAARDLTRAATIARKYSTQSYIAIEKLMHNVAAKTLAEYLDTSVFSQNGETWVSLTALQAIRNTGQKNDTSPTVGGIYVRGKATKQMVFSQPHVFEQKYTMVPNMTANVEKGAGYKRSN